MSENKCCCGHDAEKNKTLEEIIAKHKDIEGALIPILHEAQELFGYLSEETQQKIADGLGIPLAEVYGVATFYSRFTLEPKGKYNIQICLGTACYVKGSQSLLDSFCNRLGIKAGQTTEDGLFTIDVLRCIGACGLAPVVSVNGKIYPHVTVKDVDKIIAERKKGEENNETK